MTGAQDTGDGRMNRLYVVATWLPRRETIGVGALGSVTFARGWYAYVGSARRGRDARVARHMRATKPLRWHADYVFTRRPATRAWTLDTPLSECRLARLLTVADGGTPGPGGFGAGDCGCAGHLVRFDCRRSLAAAVRAIGPVRPCRAAGRLVSRSGPPRRAAAAREEVSGPCRP